LIGHGNGVAAVRFATLLDSDIGSLPNGSLSAIVMRSVLHHFLDVPAFIRATARTLRPGGSLIFQEPCAGGYLLMGLLARMLGGEVGRSLTDAQREKANTMAETMAAYHRLDIDKTEWEDKHSPEQIQEWAQSAGLVTRYFSNHHFEDFAYDPVQTNGIHFHKFMEDYMNYCMGFGAADAAAMMEPLTPYTEYLLKACGGTREPQLMGVFVLQRSGILGSRSSD
jgi:2-polyprenyl-3-methyl-5-hydroxy-6-metoxy-1,4-benzoquinol methylase